MVSAAFNPARTGVPVVMKHRTGLAGRFQWQRFCFSSGSEQAASARRSLKAQWARSDR